MPGSRASRQRMALIVGAGAVVIIAVLFIALGHFSHPGALTNAMPAPAVAAAEKSICVLPFADMSETHDQEYFADGIAETLLSTLVNVPHLRVIGRTSSFRFKGKNEDLRSIGTQLNAEYLVEGSVRRSGSRMRVTAQLIDAATGMHKWSDSFDRAISDSLVLQDEISTAIARSLDLAIPRSQRQRISEDAFISMLGGRSAYER